ncbi:MAG: hypothetical protein ACOC9P_02625, partial [bacterium]
LRPDLRLTVAGQPMGGEAVVDDSPAVKVFVACDQPVHRLEIVRDGRVIAASTHDELTVTRRYVDEDCPVGAHYYYVHVVFAGSQCALPFNTSPAYGNHAWSSPVWVKRRQP